MFTDSSCALRILCESYIRWSYTNRKKGLAKAKGEPPGGAVLTKYSYGGRRRRTHLLEDQLNRADAGSWQIADRYYMAS